MMTGSPCEECRPLCRNGAGGNEGAGVSTGEEPDGRIKTRTRYYFTAAISVLLPRSGSLANLFYDDILCKIFIDSLLSLEAIWGIRLPPRKTFHFCHRIGDECTQLDVDHSSLDVNSKPSSWLILRKFGYYLLIILMRLFSSTQLTHLGKSNSKQCKQS